MVVTKKDVCSKASDIGKTFTLRVLLEILPNNKNAKDKHEKIIQT